MSFAVHYSLDDRLADSTVPESESAQLQSLRPRCSEVVVLQCRQNSSESVDPDSSTLTIGNDPHFHRGSGSVDSSGGDRNRIRPGAHPFAECLAGGRTKRFGNNAAPNQLVKEFPLVATRPPLRPTISCGSEFSFSYNGYVPTDLGQKSGDITLEKDLEQQRSGRLRFFVCFSFLCLINLLSGINATSLALLLPSIANKFHASSNQAFWIATSYLLAVALIQPLSMRLSSAAGGKWIISIALTLFTAGSTVSATAENLDLLFAGRALCGAGSGTAMIISQLISRQLASPRNDKCAELSMSLFYWVGAAVGPVYGTIVAQTGDWHHIFWINVPCCLIGLVALLLLLRLPSTGSTASQLLRVDYGGWALLAGVACSACLTLSWAGTLYPWSSWHIVLPLTISPIAFGCWVAYACCCSNPIIPVSIFRKPAAFAACFGTLVHGMLFTAVVYFGSIYFSFIMDLDVVVSSNMTLPWTLGLVAGASLTFICCPSMKYNLAMVLGWVFTTVGFGLLIGVKTDVAIAEYMFIGLLTGMALGILVPTLSAVIQDSATNDDETIYATPLHIFFSTLGQALGVVIGSCVFLDRLGRQTLIGLEASDAVVFIDRLQTDSLENSGLDVSLVQSYVSSLRYLCIVFCVFAGLGLLFSLPFVKRRRPEPAFRTSEKRLDDMIAP